MMNSSPPVPLHFLVPGFSKCGTTTLCALLAEHPQLYMPTGVFKEPCFFKDPNFQERWSWYAKHFEHAPSGGLLGEGSQCYATVTQEKHCSKRILTLYPRIKLIFIARDPIDRIESSYREFHHRGRMYGPVAPFRLDQAFMKFPVLIEDARYFTRLDN